MASNPVRCRCRWLDIARTLGISTSVTYQYLRVAEMRYLRAHEVSSTADYLRRFWRLGFVLSDDEVEQYARLLATLLEVDPSHGELAEEPRLQQNWRMIEIATMLLDHHPEFLGMVIQIYQQGYMRVTKPEPSAPTWVALPATQTTLTFDGTTFSLVLHRYSMPRLQDARPTDVVIGFEEADLPDRNCQRVETDLRRALRRPGRC